MIKISSPIIGDEELAAANQVLASGMLAQGPAVAELEKTFADYCGSRYAVAVSSGTSALHCALYAFEVNEGDEVITTPFSFVATANAILMQGARPVFTDIDPVTFNIDPEQIEKSITKKTKAILPVDLFGHVYDVGAVNAVAETYGLKIIEDACQAHAAEYEGRRAGTFGDAGCFSFYATKNMTTGEGGMIITNDEAIAGMARGLRHHGQGGGTRYRYDHLGFNYRMTDISAAIGIEQLKKLDDFTTKRIANAEMLTQGLADIEGIIAPTVKGGYKHAFHQFTIRVTDRFKTGRDELMRYLETQGIETAVFYPQPLHLFPHLRASDHEQGSFPVAERLCKEVLSLPVHPLLGKEDISSIIKAIRGV